MKEAESPAIFVQVLFAILTAVFIIWLVWSIYSAREEVNRTDRAMELIKKANTPRDIFGKPIERP